MNVRTLTRPAGVVVIIRHQRILENLQLPDNLTFDSDNWNINQQFTVGGSR